MGTATRFSWASAIVVAAACGGTTAQSNGVDSGASTDAGQTTDDGGTADASPPQDTGADVPEPPDNGPWPADHYPMPQMTNMGGGPMIQAPRWVTVTFVGNQMRDDLRAFDDSIPTAAWYAAEVDGYGLGTSTAGVYAELPDTVSNKTLDDSGDIQPMIQNLVSSGALPPPDAHAVYQFFFPQSTTIMLGGMQSCNSFGAYHNSAGILIEGGILDVPYSIIPDCGGGLQEATLDVSHELDEVSTDYHPGNGYEALNGAWWPGGGESADICQGWGYELDAQGNPVAKGWNNAAAKASHDPCQPASPGEIFYDVALPTKVAQYSGATGTFSSDGFVLMKPGETKTIDAVFFSDAKLPHDASLAVGHHQRGNPGLTPIASGVTASVSPDKAHNGMHVTVTITLDSTVSPGDHTFVVRSTLGGQDHHDWPAILRVQ